MPVNSGATYNAMVSNLVCLLNVQQETDYNAEIQDNVGFLFHVLDSRFQVFSLKRFQISDFRDPGFQGLHFP